MNKIGEAMLVGYLAGIVLCGIMICASKMLAYLETQANLRKIKRMYQ